MVGEITLVDRGRGLQLSTSRITVMDMVPYFRRGCSREEIIRWLPTLASAEIDVVDAYYRAHKKELDAEDDRILEYREEQLRLQRQRFPMKDETKEERKARFREIIKKRQGANDEGILADINVIGPVSALVRQCKRKSGSNSGLHLTLNSNTSRMSDCPTNPPILTSGKHANPSNWFW